VEDSLIENSHGLTFVRATMKPSSRSSYCARSARVRIGLLGANRVPLLSRSTTLVSVSFVQESPLDMIDESGNILKSRQENYLFLSGAIYIINMELLRTTRRFYHPGISAF
jgi:hypothetical protein